MAYYPISFFERPDGFMNIGEYFSYSLRAHRGPEPVHNGCLESGRWIAMAQESIQAVGHKRKLGALKKEGLYRLE